ncbi:MAG: beta-class carbonic anhydrase [Candidatus Nanopelagicales bacterium]
MADTSGTGAFADVLSANARFAENFDAPGMDGRAARGLAVVTCMDSRIDPLHVVGMKPGDAKILRNAGARVTDDVLRTLVLASYLLDVERVLVMPHTRCAMAGKTDASLHARFAAEHGVDTRWMSFGSVMDQQAELVTDLQRIRSFPMLPAGLTVMGAIYDVDTGRLEMLEGAG